MNTPSSIGIMAGGKKLVLPSLYPKQEEFCTAEASYIGYGGA